MLSRLVRWIGMIFAVIVIVALVGLLAINTFNWNFAAPLIARLVEDSTGYEPHFNGNLRLTMAPHPRVAVTDFVLYSPIGKTEERPFIKGERAVVEVDFWSLFKDQLTLKDFRLAEIDISILRRDGEFPDLPTRDPSKEKTEVEVPRLSSGEIHNVTVVYQDEENNCDVLTKLDRMLVVGGVPELPLAITSRGRWENLPLAADARIGAPGVITERVPMIINASAGPNIINGAGALFIDKAGWQLAELDIEADVPDFAKVLKPLDVELAELPAIKFNGTIAATPPLNISLDDFALRTPASRFTGSASAEIGNPNIVSADIVANPLALDEIINIFAATEPDPNYQSDDRLFSTKPLPALEGLKGTNGDLTFTVARVVANEAEGLLQEGTVNVELQDGVVSATTSDLKFAGGNSTFDVDLQADGNHWRSQLTARIDKAQLPQLIQPAAARQSGQTANLPNEIQGELTVAFNGRTAGDSLHALASNLDGNFIAALEEAAIGGDLIATLGITAVSPSDIVSVQPITTIPCFLASLPIDDGVARVDDVYLNSGQGEFGANGYIDLGAETLDVRITAFALDPKDGIIVPLQIKGPLLQPNVVVTPREGETAETIGKVVEKSLEGHLPPWASSVREEQPEQGCSERLQRLVLPGGEPVIAH